MRNRWMWAALAGALTAALAATSIPSVEAEEPKAATSPGGKPHTVHALVGATVIPRPGETIPSATILIRDGLIEAVGAKVAVPGDALVWDVSGLTIYPGLIEPYLRLDDLGTRVPPKGGAKKPAPRSPQGGAVHANGRVRPERNVSATLKLEGEALTKLRQAGFTSALVAPGKGVFRGTSALVALRDGSPRDQVIRAKVAQHLALEYGGWGSSSYPGSLMGAMALVRQTLLDTEHHVFAHAAYAKEPVGQKRPKANTSLSALAPAVAGSFPFCIEADDTQMLLRATRLLGEYEVVPWVVLGKADAYRWLDEVAETTAPVILSLNFPPAPRWESADERVDVEYEALRHWYLAPSTPSLLEQSRVRFAFSTQGLKDRASYRARVREAIGRGLTEEAALAAFTTAPAAMLRAPQLGVITKGAIANLTITDGALFADRTRIVDVWIDGVRYPQQTDLPSQSELAGQWSLEVNGKTIQVRLKSERGRLSGEARGPGQPGWAKLEDVKLWRDRLRLVLPSVALEQELSLPVTLRVRGRLARGRWRQGEDPQGNTRGGKVLARQQEPQAPPGAPKPAAPLPRIDLPARPAWPPLPEQAPAKLLIQNATLWTLASQGTLKQADLLIEGGVIRQVGIGIPAPAGALVIDARGRHVTPGIIDCHSHSFGTGPFNEFTRNCTAEVRTGDVIDAETVQIYRQLGGGVTTANLLHGSANAIGGQNSVLRLKWGEPAHRLLFRGAAPGVKFALGENPKQSNWGAKHKPRYPTSRMGVWSSIRERFQRARDYRRKLSAWKSGGNRGLPPRIDLQLQALSEVLANKRKVHCHSYRQDEILALIRLAEEFGFTIGTFQHVLEGYKVADEIALHGAGASTFSDWWAYKFEVYDAIAHNAALMTERGVLVSINSDSDEMARRLNQEAAKAVRYGNLSEEAALKLVTLNPARQLGISDAVGSLAVGKQADFVIWSGHPLQTTTVCEETWIQGQRYYSRARDQVVHALGMIEREALLKLARAARYAKGARKPSDHQATFPPHPKSPHARATCCPKGGAK